MPAFSNFINKTNYTSTEIQKLRALYAMSARIFGDDFHKGIKDILIRFNITETPPSIAISSPELQIHSSRSNDVNSLDSEIKLTVDYLKNYLSPLRDTSFLDKVFSQTAPNRITKIIGAALSQLLIVKIAALKDSNVDEINYKKVLINKLSTFINEIISSSEPNFKDEFSKVEGEDFFSILYKVTKCLRKIGGELNKQNEIITQKDQLNDFHAKENLKILINLTSQYLSSLSDTYPGFMIIGLLSEMYRRDSQENAFLTRTNLGKHFLDLLNTNLTHNPIHHLFSAENNFAHSDINLFNSGCNTQNGIYNEIWSNYKVKNEIIDSVKMLNTLANAATIAENIAIAFTGGMGNMALQLGPCKDWINTFMIEMLGDGLQQLTYSLKVIRTAVDLSSNISAEKKSKAASTYEECEKAIHATQVDIRKLSQVVNCTSLQALTNNFSNTLISIVRGFDNFQEEMFQYLNPSIQAKYTTKIYNFKTQIALKFTEENLSLPSANSRSELRNNSNLQFSVGITSTAKKAIDAPPARLAILPPTSTSRNFALTNTIMPPLPTNPIVTNTKTNFWQKIENKSLTLVKEAVTKANEVTKGKVPSLKKIVEALPQNSTNNLITNKANSSLQTNQISEVPETSTNNSHVIAGGSENNAELLETAESKSLLNEINSASLQNSTAVTQNLTNNLTNNEVNSMFQTNQTNTIPETSNNITRASNGGTDLQEDLKLAALKAQIEALTNQLPPEHRAQMTKEGLSKLPLEERAQMTEESFNDLPKARQINLFGNIAKAHPEARLRSDQIKEIAELTEFIRINYDVSSHADSIIKIRDKAKASLNKDWVSPNYVDKIIKEHLGEKKDDIINSYRNKPITGKEVGSKFKQLSYWAGGGTLCGIAGGAVAASSGTASVMAVGGPLAAILGVSITAGTAIAGGLVGAGIGVGIAGTIFFVKLSRAYKNLPPELKTGKFWKDLKLAFLSEFGLKSEFLMDSNQIQFLYNHIIAWGHNLVTRVETIASSPINKNNEYVATKEELIARYKLLEKIISEVINPSTPPYFASDEAQSLPPKTLLAAQQLYCMVLYLLKKDILFFPVGAEVPTVGPVSTPSQSSGIKSEEPLMSSASESCSYEWEAGSKFPLPNLEMKEGATIREELKSLVVSYIVASYEVGKKEAECSPSPVIHEVRAEQREVETPNFQHTR